MIEIQDKDIVFVTTALNTKWLKYCKESVKKYFPNSDHLIMNGKKYPKNFWFKWIDPLKQRTEKYYVVLDEDCFILNRDEILNTIVKLEKDSYHLAGVPDAYYAPRNYNSVAMNPFFMIGKLDFLKDMVLNRRWQKVGFNKSWAKNEGWMNGKTPIVKLFEPYYVFYWAMLKHGAKFLYLYPNVNKELSNNGKFPATNVKMHETSVNMCVHMWYLRDCNRPVHKFRYDKLEAILNE